MCQDVPRTAAQSLRVKGVAFSYDLCCFEGKGSTRLPSGSLAAWAVLMPLSVPFLPARLMDRELGFVWGLVCGMALRVCV
jgi:hypothetical protein